MNNTGVCAILIVKCKTNLLTYGLQYFVKKPELSMWHKRNCLMRTCTDCGLDLLKLCPLELGSNKLVK
jgi:hypothetical protein